MLNGLKTNSRVTVGLLMEFDETWMGGVNYIINLVKTLQHLPKEEKPGIIAITRKNPAKDFLHFVNELSDVKLRYLGEPSSLARIPERVRTKFLKIYRALNIRRIIKEEHIDVLFPAMNILDHMLPATSLGWIPDFQHRHLKYLFSEEDYAYRDLHYSRLSKWASCMIFSSDCARRDYERFYPHYKSKNFVYSFCTVIDNKNTIKSLEFLQEKYGLEEKFFYLPNQFWVHKNHMVVFKALDILKKRGHKIKVVCTGSSHEHRSSRHYEDLMSFIRDKGLDDVKNLGLLPRDHQYSLYYYAHAVIQPSLFEGWSSIVEDARAFSKVIVLSDIPVHREQNPPGAVYFNPHDEEELAEKLLAVWESDLPRTSDYEELVARQNKHVQAIARNLLRVFETCKTM